MSKTSETDKIIALTNIARRVIAGKTRAKLAYDIRRGREGRSAWFQTFLAETTFTQAELADAVEVLASRLAA
jgi:hypothetical protein